MKKNTIKWYPYKNNLKFLFIKEKWNNPISVYKIIKIISDFPINKRLSVTLKIKHSTNNRYKEIVRKETNPPKTERPMNVSNRIKKERKKYKIVLTHLTVLVIQ